MQIRTDICTFEIPLLNAPAVFDANCFSSGVIGWFSALCDRLALSKQANHEVRPANFSPSSFPFAFLHSSLTVLGLKAKL